MPHVTIEEMRLEEATRDLNEQLFKQAQAGRTVHVVTGAHVLGIGPKSETHQTWIKLVKEPL